MKLYLSSYRVSDLAALTQLIGKDPAQTRVALVPNAKDYYAGRARDFKIRSVADYFTELGFQTSIVDLRQHRPGDDWSAILADYDLLWAMGGNTFMLRYEVRRSGLEDILPGLLQSGLIYGGESAGAIIAGRDLHGIEFADEPEFAEEVIWEGLLLTDHFVLPHVGNEAFGDAIQRAEAMHIDDDSLIKLTDTQALVVDGDRRYVVASPAAE